MFKKRISVPKENVLKQFLRTIFNITSKQFFMF